jgi:hypothetical protein
MQAVKWSYSNVAGKILDELRPAGFSAVKGRKVIRELPLRTEIQLEQMPQFSSSSRHVYSARVVFGQPGSLDQDTYDGYWNFHHLGAITGQKDNYGFIDGTPWEDHQLKRDIASVLLEYFSKLNNFDAALGFLLSDGAKFAQRTVTIAMNGDLDKRDAIIAGYVMAKEASSDAAQHAALSALRDYANSSAAAMNDVSEYFELTEDTIVPNVLRS